MTINDVEVRQAENNEVTVGVVSEYDIRVAECTRECEIDGETKRINSAWIGGSIIVEVNGNAVRHSFRYLDTIRHKKNGDENKIFKGIMTALGYDVTYNSQTKKLEYNKVGEGLIPKVEGKITFVDVNKNVTNTDELNNDKTVYEEAREFIQEAHRLDMNVIVDLPSCGSYDLSLKRPNWFILDKNNEALIPADWTDVRLFKIYNQDKTLNQDVLNNFKSFVDMVQGLGFDGIRADVAAIKPPNFWKELIKYSRSKNKDFFFLAEANVEWGNPAPNGVSHYSSVDELLEAGFDTYYASWSDFKNIKTKAELL